jgi:hypothetical protein
MTENVIKLEFRSPHMRDDDSLTFIACGICRNKTYTLMNDFRSSFPIMKCAACGQAMGRMGWYHDDLPEEGKPA